jgi:hypothetical protein
MYRYLFRNGPRLLGSVVEIYDPRNVYLNLITVLSDVLPSG